jgi:hypothetical protein
MTAHDKSWPLMAVVGFALLTDYFIYGLILSLAGHASGHATGEAQFGLIAAMRSACWRQHRCSAI